MAKQKKTKTYNGKLIYSQDAQYILISPTATTNISKILDQICESKGLDNICTVKIMDCCKLLFEESGRLLKYKSYDSGVVDYHINGNCLGDLLFDSTDLDLEITISAKAGYGKV